MPEVYLVFVGLLFVLAISDLVVGVSNDAVNFLNSAIGSRVAPRGVVLLIAAAGIFVGATFSSGMMEVARKGIFRPEMFFFADVMVIFLAVMLTDIILLDLFNTFGLPTSTTVSIVFELLGAALALAVLRVAESGESAGALTDYINHTTAITIISGIFLSIAIAFGVGALVQFVSRLIFTFHYRERLRSLGPAWAGFALTALAWFLLVKGAKGASFIPDGVVAGVKEHSTWILGGTFLGLTALTHVLSALGVNVLKVVVLFGTFSLAMAFASNDLVNFIGVPIAGFESFVLWSDSGLAPEEMTMGALAQPIRTRTYFLVIAGLVMVTTLWLSKKARSVTDTEVDLGRQDEGDERFTPRLVSRSLVRSTLWLRGALAARLPQNMATRVESRFAKPEPAALRGDAAAFDLVRASVNLTVASILISIATSFKLPLSTTYVSFMVAMGSSLADRAWGRDSAVYRVAGVLHVVEGWVMTALIAFTVAALFAVTIHYFGSVAVAALVLLTLFLLFRTHVYHRTRSARAARRRQFDAESDSITRDRFLSESRDSVCQTLGMIREAFDDAVAGLLTEDRQRTGNARRLARSAKDRSEDLRYRLIGSIRRLDSGSGSSSRLPLLAYDLEQDALHAVSPVVRACHEHLENAHSPLAEDQVERLQALRERVTGHLESIMQAFASHDLKALERAARSKGEFLDQIDAHLDEQVRGVQSHSYGRRNSLLVFTLLLETKDVISVASRFAKLYARLERSEEGPPLSFLTEP